LCAAATVQVGYQAVAEALISTFSAGKRGGERGRGFAGSEDDFSDFEG
jgi:hypothetical protein